MYIGIMCIPYLSYTTAQEGIGSITFERHVSNRLKLYIRNPGVKSCRLVHICVQSEGGWSEGVQSFLDLPPKMYRADLRNF